MNTSIKASAEHKGPGVPELFVSLHDTLNIIAAANHVTYQVAAKQLKRLLRNEDDAPAWYRFTDWGERGRPEPEYGEKFGMRELLEFAAMSGEPVEYDLSRNYEVDFGVGSATELSKLPVFNFMIEGPTLGFQIDAIGPFLAQHGIDGFGAANSAGQGSVSGVPSKPIPRQRAQEEQLLHALRLRGVDPLAMECAPPGNKRWPLREAVLIELDWSREVMRKAWQRLRSDGRIKDA